MIEERTVEVVRWPNRYRRPAKDPGVTRTKQHFTESCDVNKIVETWVRTGIAPDYRQNPMYGDFSDVPDFQSALDQIRAAEQDFMKLPAELRARFSNSPAELLAFLEDPANHDEARDLGMLPPLEAEPEAPAPEPAPAEEPTP